MANKKISDLTAKGANLETTDVLEIAEDAGGGTYVTKSITGAEIIAAGTDTNFANADLTFTANRTHDLAGYVATLDNAELKIIADANTSGDVPFEVTQADGTTSVFKITGDKTIVASFFKSVSRIGLKHFDIDTDGVVPVLNLLALSGTYSQGRILGSNGLEFYSQGAVDGGLCAMNIDSGKFGLREFTISTLPAVANNTTGVKGVILVTDATPRPTICYSNGTNWIDIQTGSVVV